MNDLGDIEILSSDGDLIFSGSCEKNEILNSVFPNYPVLQYTEDDILLYQYDSSLSDSGFFYTRPSIGSVDSGALEYLRNSDSGITVGIGMNFGRFFDTDVLAVKDISHDKFGIEFILPSILGFAGSDDACYFENNEGVYNQDYSYNEWDMSSVEYEK